MPRPVQSFRFAFFSLSPSSSPLFFHIALEQNFNYRIASILLISFSESDGNIVSPSVWSLVLCGDVHTLHLIRLDLNRIHRHRNIPICYNFSLGASVLITNTLMRHVFTYTQPRSRRVCASNCGRLAPCLTCLHVGRSLFSCMRNAENHLILEW